MARLIERPALAGDDDDELRAARLRMAQEAAQGLMRLGLVHPVQVDRAVDLGAPARELALQPPLDRRERRRGPLRRPACRRPAAVRGAEGAGSATSFEGVGKPRRGGA